MNHEQEEMFYICGTLLLVILIPILIFFKVFRNAKNGKKLPSINNDKSLEE